MLLFGGVNDWNGCFQILRRNLAAELKLVLVEGFVLSDARFAPHIWIEVGMGDLDQRSFVFESMTDGSIHAHSGLSVTEITQVRLVLLLHYHLHPTHMRV